MLVGVCLPVGICLDGGVSSSSPSGQDCEKPAGGRHGTSSGAATEPALCQGGAPRVGGPCRGLGVSGKPALSVPGLPGDLDSLLKFLNVIFFVMKEEGHPPRLPPQRVRRE